MPSHSHTTNNEGSHIHGLWSGQDWSEPVGSLNRSDTHGIAGIARDWGNKWCYKAPANGHDYVEYSGSHTHTISSVGQNAGHNNMQPYYVVNTWIRIS